MSPATAAITQMLRVMMRRFIEDNNLLDEEESDDDGDDANGGATISTGGSSGASQRSSRTRYDYDLCRRFLYNQILGDNATVDFKKVYRISKERFQAIYDDIQATGNSFFFNTRDVGVPPAARMLLPIQCLAFGVSPVAFANFYQMSAQFARLCCAEFDKVMCHLYVQEYIRLPTPEDLLRITALHQHKHGVPGMLGSLDCMHTTWKNCPMAWKGSFQGKEKSPTMVLEAMCDQNLWFWHAFYGVAGSMNDLNVLRLSKLLKMFVTGEFEKLERLANIVPYSIHDEEFQQLFVLVDGIYPKYSRFVKGIKDPLTEPEKKYSAWQEAARKDIERAFGVLQSQWKFMATPIKAYSTEVIRTRVKTCIILHNMNVSDRVMEGDVRARYNPAYNLEVAVPPDANADAVGAEEENEGGNNMDRWEQLRNADEHRRLFEALMETYI